MRFKNTIPIRSSEKQLLSKHSASPFKKIYYQSGKHFRWFEKRAENYFARTQAVGRWLKPQQQSYLYQQIFVYNSPTDAAPQFL